MSARPIPARLVQQIQAGSFTEMRDLLWDNVAIRSQLEDLHSALGLQLVSSLARPRVREVTSLPSWICCFLTFLAVQTSDPVTRDKATYAMLVVREAIRHGGQGWLDYDRLFCQQATLNPNLSWNRIHPELQVTTILSQPSTSAGSFYTLCQECDHSSQQCTLGQLLQPAMWATHEDPSRGPQGCSLGRICTSWNNGACIYPRSCNYRHICLLCFQSSHRARDCRSAPGAATRGAAGSSLPRGSRPSQE